MSLVLAFVFWTCLALLVHSYALFPLALRVLARGAGPGEPPAAPAASAPRVTVIVSAYNEEAHIESRIRNVLEQDYPAERLSVRVGSDGSADRTAALATALAGPRVHVHPFAVNRGKASVLNDLVAASGDADILVFTDANTRFAPDAVRRLVEAMAPGVGAACGELVLEKPGRGGNQDHAYWSFERRLKAAESDVGGLVGANGGIYAIRRELYEPIPPDTICDDFVISMRIASAGHGLVYAPAAVAYEDTPSDPMVEFHRRVRIGIGNYQALFEYPQFLGKSPVMLRFTYFSHKVLRWFTPHLLLCMLLTSILLAGAAWRCCSSRVMRRRSP